MSRSLAAKTATFVVAKDGSGQYKTVQAAIDAAARSGVSGRKGHNPAKQSHLDRVRIFQYSTNVPSTVTKTPSSSIRRGNFIESVIFLVRLTSYLAMPLLSFKIAHGSFGGNLFGPALAAILTDHDLEELFGRLVNPTGWLEWDNASSLNTLYYAKYRNFGPSSSVRRRVKWHGFHVINSTTVASGFTVGRFIAGGTWLPSTGVLFASGL
ncbi:hypothetical protein Ancab_008817 [Ancistrocladus abbreviatus]